MNEEYKLLIMSNSSFNNEHMFNSCLEAIQESILKGKTVSFVLAMLPGADALAYMLAHKNNTKVYEFYPNKNNGVNAHKRMQSDMFKFADGALVFCEPKDDVEYVLNIMERQKKQVAVVHYKETS